jgi:RNA polymerase sigma-32 factor
MTKLPTATPEGALSLYLRDVGKFPMLEAAEEYRLAKAWREHRASDAAHKLVTSHLRLVARIAMEYRGYGLPISELISEGHVGIMQAVMHFDPDRGFRLSTYAIWWIRASIQEYILRSWSLVKIGTTTAQKKLFFNLRKLKIQLRAIDEGDMSPETVKVIADRLEVPACDVISMNRRLAGRDHSLNAPLGIDGDGEWQDWLVDQSENQEIQLADRQELTKRQRLLSQALKSLTERERHILTKRRLREEPATLADLSGEYGISRERVRQIDLYAFEKVQQAIRVAALDERIGLKMGR